MGYTHYWYRKQELPKAQWWAFLADVRKIMKASKIPLADGHGTHGTKPIVNDEMIVFNGVEDDAYETFYIERVFSGYRQEDEKGRLFECCKTALRPYDAVVCAVLLAFKAHFLDVKVSSDGNWSDWSLGAKLYAKVTGVFATNPLED